MLDHQAKHASTQPSHCTFATAYQCSRLPGELTAARLRHSWDAVRLPAPTTPAAGRILSAAQPEPQRGIREAYRVCKEGGLACMIGPVYPTFWLSRMFADVWMLFPTEDEYIEVSGHHVITDAQP
jgi:hypothetical protein